MKIIIFLLYWLALVATSMAFSFRKLLGSAVFSFIVGIVAFAVASALMFRL